MVLRCRTLRQWIDASERQSIPLVPHSSQLGSAAGRSEGPTESHTEAFLLLNLRGLVTLNLGTNQIKRSGDQNGHKTSRREFGRTIAYEVGPLAKKSGTLTFRQNPTGAYNEASGLSPNPPFQTPGTQFDVGGTHAVVLGRMENHSFASDSVTRAA